MNTTPIENYEHWVNIRDTVLYTRPAIPFDVQDISFYESKTLMKKWCDVTNPPEVIFDANKPHEHFWDWSQHEHADWLISKTHPFMYVWGTETRPLFEMQTRELTIRRRYVTLSQLATYDLSHPLTAPTPKQYDKAMLKKLCGLIVRQQESQVIYPRASALMSTGASVDFYDVVDVIYVLHIFHLNGRFDMTRIEHFWLQRFEAYHVADFGDK